MQISIRSASNAWLAALLLVSTSLASTYLLRHHLRDLSELARTYKTFYPTLQQHSEILFRYSAPAEQMPISEYSSLELVPKIIHQIFLVEGRNSTLSKYEEAIESCKTSHPDWQYTMWTDETANDFMREHYPAIWPHYQNYGQSIQRANVLRYALLEHYGGAYLDIDITCRQPLDNLRHVPLLTPGAHPAGVNNAFILSKPHHPFLQHILSGLPSRGLTWGAPYVENMLSTGCGYFGNRWMSYVRGLKSKSHNPPEENVYILADADGHLDSHMLRGKVTTPLFTHGGASSWHSWDAAVIVLVGKHYLFALSILFAGFMLSIWASWRIATRPNLRRRLSGNSLEKMRDEEGAAPLMDKTRMG